MVKRHALESWRLATEARALAQQVGDPLGEAEAILGLDHAWGSFMDPGAALFAFRRAEQIFRVNGRADGVAASKAAMAHALLDLGQERDAIALAMSALQEPSLGAVPQVQTLIRVALCHSNLGATDHALSILRNEALPMARAMDNPLLLAKCLWAQGLMHLRLLIEARLPAQSTAFPGVAASRSISPQTILALLDEASAVLPADARRTYIDLTRHAVIGMAGSPDVALPALSRLADDLRTQDPPLSGWACYFSGTILIRSERFQPAFDMLERALALAQEINAQELTREVLLQQSRVCEKLGDVERSFGLFKQFTVLLLRSAMLSPVSTHTAEEPLADATDAKPARATQPPLRNLEPLQVKRAVQFIDEHRAEPLRVADVVAHCGVSRRNLEVVFKSSKGTTIATYIRARKMERAIELLRDTDWTIHTVARCTGYRSPSAFAQDFRLRFGLNPAMWRGTILQPNETAGSATAPSPDMLAAPPTGGTRTKRRTG